MCVCVCVWGGGGGVCHSHSRMVVSSLLNGVSRSGAASLSVGLISCVLVVRIIVSVPFLSVRAQELCESRGGRVLRFLWT